MPRSSTIRTDGRPSGEAVASAAASGSDTPSARAAAYHSCSWASGSGVSHIAIATYLVSRYSCMPSRPALAAEAGGLDAAERRGGVGDHALVEADHAGLEALDDAERALEVARVDVGDEPVLRVVGRGDRGLLVVEADHGRDRAEDLLVQQPRLRLDAGQHGRVEEVAGALAPRAADHGLGALAERVLRRARRPCRAGCRRSAARPGRRPRCRGRPSSRRAWRRASR